MTLRQTSIILSALAVVSVFFGCGGPDAALKKADKFYALGEYYDAGAQYKKAYSKTPAKERTRRGLISKKVAECYRRINSTSKATAAYNNVIRYRQADTLTHLRLAQQQMKNGNYKEAAKNFETASDSLTSIPLQQLAKNGLISARQAPQWKKEASAYTVKRENLFNSRRDDYSPMLSGDNDQLYLTSTRNDAQGDELSGITGAKAADIFMSQKDDKGKWSRPQPIDSEVNSDHDEGACAFSPDGRTMYLTRCATDPTYPRYAVIMASERSDASWSKPQEVKISRDTLTSFAHPAVSPDGEWLYFTSDMPGGMGGLDIWRCRLLAHGETGPMENLGLKVNTAGDEMFPAFRPNGDFYFSSNGHPGLGGLDIYFVKGGNTVIEHPGFPLNSQGDDFGMTFEGRLNKGYFCSNRGDARGFDHIYSFYNPEII